MNIEYLASTSTEKSSVSNEAESQASKTNPEVPIELTEHCPKPFKMELASRVYSKAISDLYAFKHCHHQAACFLFGLCKAK